MMTSELLQCHPMLIFLHQFSYHLSCPSLYLDDGQRVGGVNRTSRRSALHPAERC